MKALTRVYTVDANVILRYLLRDDEALWQKAYAAIRAVNEGSVKLVCDPVILAEVVFVLGSIYRLTRQRIYELLGPLVKAEGFLIPNKDLYIRALELYGNSVSHFGDACACAMALDTSEGRLLSFDKKISNVPGVERLEELTP